MKNIFTGGLGLLPLCFILLFSFQNQSVKAQDGAKLFKANCATCHKLSDKKSTGPGLQGYWDRIPGGSDEGKKAWAIEWVKNTGAIAEKDPYIKALKEEYSGVLMTSQGHLSDEEVWSILEYVKSYTPPAASAAASKESMPAFFSKTKAEEKTDTSIYWVLVILVIALILFNTLRNVNFTLDNVIREKDGKEKLESRGLFSWFLHWCATHKLATALVIIGIVMIGVVKGWYTLKEIGVFQGYAPEQPIKFSHKIHAGDKKINCVYCHSGAEKGKTAGIPSVNICMNCHKGIEEGTWTGTEEISKIHAAAGWNTEMQAYDKPQKPIEWVRIHNLPDFAYFNHSQHVVVGEQKCQTCHGPVEEMHLLEQHSELTMGWCIDCHNKTDVPGLQEDPNNPGHPKNPYYGKMYQDLIEKHKGRVSSFQVKDIGGLECAKCHY